VAASDRAKHAGHGVASLVREQYIHQAHTIIEGDRSHLDHYNDIASRTRAASDDLASLTRTKEQRDIADDVASLVRQNDEDFVANTLPAIDRGDRAEVLRLHMAMEKIVGRATKRVGELNDRFEADSDSARVEADAVRARARLTTIVCFAVAAVLAALASMLTTRSVARRVATLRAGTRRIGDGDLSHRIDLGGSDELAERARSDAEMAAKLAGHQRELLRSQKLASIGRLSASVAHEINGPLGIILGYAKIIRAQGLDEEALGAIEEEARQCQRIVQGLLDLSRNDGLTMTRVDLGRLAREVVERMRAAGQLDLRDVRLPEESTAVVRGDESKLRQALLSILTNAVDATASGGKIAIESERRGDRAALAVVDDGSGFCADAKAHLFEPFFTTKPHGTGLGLALAHTTVEAQQGELRVVSGSGGTRVEIVLPVSEA
jgi:signal transduction histidine kinase